MRRGRLRPHLSLIGPTASCPSAMPVRQAVRVSWAVAAEVCSAPVTSGSAGRYMSMDSGGTAVSPPSTRVTRKPVRRRAVSEGPATGDASGMRWVSRADACWRP